MAERNDSPGDAPFLGGIYGALSSPVRQIFMVGAVWRMAKSLPGTSHRILEIGSWGGFSTLTWAWALDCFAGGGSVHCIDPWLPYVDRTVNGSKIYDVMDEALATGEPYDVFRHNIQFAPPTVEIGHSRGTSRETLPALSDESFHLIYIDGDHSYEAVSFDIRTAMPLIADGGIICGDDLEVQAHQCTPELLTLDPNLDLVEDTDADISFHPGVTRAVGESFGEVSAWAGFWAMQKTGGAWQPVSLDGMPFKPPPHLSNDMISEIEEALGTPPA